MEDQFHMRFTRDAALCSIGNAVMDTAGVCKQVRALSPESRDACDDLLNRLSEWTVKFIDPAIKKESEDG